FDNANVTNFHPADQLGLDIQQGAVQLLSSNSATTNPLGTSSVTGKSTTVNFDDNGLGVNGNVATLVVSSSSSSGTVTYDNPIIVNAGDAAISAGANAHRCGR